MSDLKTEKLIILAKLEVTYGTDPTPAGADAMLATNVQLRAMEGNTIDRGLMRDGLGNQLQFHVGTHVGLSFDIEMAGAGTAGDVPAYSPLMRAAGFAETDGVSDVQYDPVSSSEESCTIYFYWDGQLHKLTGVRGSVSPALNVNGIPVFRFSFMGLWNEPATAAMPTAVFSGFVKPVPVNATNTPTVSLHGYTPKMASLSIDGGVRTGYREYAAGQGPEIEVRDRRTSGSMRIAAPILSTKNYFQIAKAETLGALQVVHGTTAGNIVQIDGPNVQILTPEYSDDDGTLMLDLGLSFIPTDGGVDDEIKYTIK